MLPAVLATASMVALGACDNADATLAETETAPTEFELSAEDLQLSAQELALLCGDTTDIVDGDTTDIVDEEEPPVQSPGVIGGDPGQWTPGHPNEPSGFSRWAEHDFTSLPNGSLSDAGIATTSYGGNYRIVDDETASNGKALRIRYPEGLSDGTSPGRFFVFDKNGSGGSTALREWYVSLWIMLEENPRGGWEAPPAVQKLWYNGMGRRGRASRGGHVVLSNGGGANSSSDGFATRLLARSAPGAVVDVFQNNGKQVIPGNWHHVEFHGTVSTPGRADGSYRMWIDGELVGDHRDVQNLHPDDWTTGFFEFHWAPVWGGKCSAGCPKKRDDYMRIAHLYISGIPQ